MTVPSLKAFYPSTCNPLLIGLVQWVAPVVAQQHFKFQVVTHGDSLDRLRSLRDQRLILLPNHTCFDDPPVIYALSGQVGLRFQYLAALDLFQSALGSWLQRLGVYSIRRGFADRTSIAYTLDILSERDCKLVIFAEGGCSFQNDTVMAFRPGAIQMAFQALNRAHKRSEPLPNLYLLPVGIKYQYCQDMSSVIESSLHALEQALDLAPVGSPYQRLQNIAARRLVFWEQLFQMQPNPCWSWDERVRHLKVEILNQGEEHLGLDQILSDPYRDRAYRILYTLNERKSIENSNTEAIHTNLVHTNLSQKLDAAIRQVLNYDAIYENYIAEYPTQERFLDTLIRLERDVFQIDQPRPKGNRKAHILVGEAINLKNWFPQYLSDRSETVTHLNQILESQVQEQVNLLKHYATINNNLK